MIMPHLCMPLMHDVEVVHLPLLKSSQIGVPSGSIRATELGAIPEDDALPGSGSPRLF